MSELRLDDALKAGLLIRTLFFPYSERLKFEDIFLHFLIYIFIPVHCHKCRGFGHRQTQCPTRGGSVLPYQQQGKQAEDEAKEVIITITSTPLSKM